MIAQTTPTGPIDKYAQLELFPPTYPIGSPSPFDNGPARRVEFIAHGPLKTTEVYHEFWRFAAERLNIFYRRLDNTDKGPWTDDVILQEYKFTNTYRVCDRVTQYLIKHVQYNTDELDDPKEIFFRTLLFKLFNSIDTWEALKQRIGPLTWADFSFSSFLEALFLLAAKGHTLYSPSYIMPSGTAQYGYHYKYLNHLIMLEQIMNSGVPEKIIEGECTLSEVYGHLRPFPCLGDFLAYQFTIDLNYSTIVDAAESNFVIPGPGARSGINKCFIDTGKWKHADIIKYVCDNQDQEFRRYGIDFKRLWGRPLQLIDVQNLFCEIDKYSRERFPKLNKTNAKIKQKYTPYPKPLPWLFFPPKWGINEFVDERPFGPHKESWT